MSCRAPCRPQASWQWDGNGTSRSYGNEVGEAFSETLSCPSTNLDAQLPLQGTLPNCSFDCDPIDREGGYSKGAGGEWTCAEGFAGEAA